MDTRNSSKVVKLDRLALIEANYHYELIARGETFRPPQCQLLFGHRDDKGITQITQCMTVPLSLKLVDESEASFQYDSTQIGRRIKLLNDTNPHVSPYGIMVVNDRFYDYTTIIERLKAQVSDIQYVFTYEPHKDSEKDLDLSCFYIGQEIGGRINLERVDFDLQSINIAIEKESERPCFENQPTEDQEDQTEKEFMTRLLGKLDRILKYLDDQENNDPKILRHISMLVSQLRRPPTTDIEEEIMNKESEINVLRITCQQWEMSTSQSNKST